jgi:LysM repeat protein
VKHKGISLFVMVLSALLGLGVLPIGAAPPSDAQVHVVQPGENLSTIALRYGTTTTALIRANGIANPNRIYVGQRLTISHGGSAGATAGGAYHTVQRGQNLETIAARYHVSPDALAQANGISNPNLIYTGQRLRISGRTAAMVGTHVVQRGESLSGIARRYGVSVSALVQANGLHNPNFVFVGQRLRTPASGFSSAAAGAAPVTNKLIDIDLSNQRMTVWENGRVKWHWVCSTGEPGRPTYPGRFGVISKIPNAYSSVYRLQMPWWLGVYWAGSLQNGIHALPIQANGQPLWSGFLGRRVSYGCIILDTTNARALYHWADMGTPVTIHY